MSVEFVANSTFDPRFVGSMNGTSTVAEMPTMSTSTQSVMEAAYADSEPEADVDYVVDVTPEAILAEEVGLDALGDDELSRNPLKLSFLRQNAAKFLLLVSPLALAAACTPDTTQPVGSTTTTSLSTTTSTSPSTTTTTPRTTTTTTPRTTTTTTPATTTSTSTSTTTLPNYGVTYHYDGGNAYIAGDTGVSTVLNNELSPVDPNDSHTLAEFDVQMNSTSGITAIEFGETSDVGLYHTTVPESFVSVWENGAYEGYNQLYVQDSTTYFPGNPIPSGAKLTIQHNASIQAWQLKINDAPFVHFPDSIFPGGNLTPTVAQFFGEVAGLPQSASPNGNNTFAGPSSANFSNITYIGNAPTPSLGSIETDPTAYTTLIPNNKTIEFGGPGYAVTAGKAARAAIGAIIGNNTVTSSGLANLPTPTH